MISVTWARKNDRLTGASDRVTKAVINTFRAQAPAVKDRVDRRTPVDTGNLRSRNDVTANGPVIQGKNEEDYAGYVHEGTHRMSGRPFMREGFEESIPILEQQLTDVITRELS
jgi:HK97 gp10 family phage protein